MIKEADVYANARRLLNEERFEEAFSLYERLAEAGDVHAKVFLAWMYAEAVGTPRNHEKALALFKAAAELGSKEGAFYYGRYALTEGRYAEALVWLQRSASQGFSPALLWLGLMYIRGWGVPVDFDHGVRLLRQAAAARNFMARRELAVLMIKGKLGLGNVLLGMILLPYAVVAALIAGLFGGYSERHIS